MLDEFSIAVDPVTTMRIEDVLRELRKDITIILVTNLVQQAERLPTERPFSSVAILSRSAKRARCLMESSRTREHVTTFRGESGDSCLVK